MKRERRSPFLPGVSPDRVTTLQQIREEGRELLAPIAAERAEAELDAFVERRARESKEANALEEAWRESERKHHEKQRRENRALWYAHFCNLAEGLRCWAAEYDERAQALLEESPS